MQEDFDSLPKSLSEEALDDSFQYDSPNEDLEDFKIPDISVIASLFTSLTSWQRRYSGDYVRCLNLKKLENRCKH